MNQDKPKHAGGRPTKYCQELADFICEKVATHTQSTVDLCRIYDELPNQETINLWRYKYPEFSDQYSRALAAKYDLIVEDTVNIADNIKEYIDKDGVSRVDGGIARKASSKIEARRWNASKYNPKKYGDSKEEVKEIVSQVVHDEIKKQKEKVDKANEKEF